MCYVKPDLVVSPKSLVSNLKVIYDGEVNSWALVEMEWGGAEAVRLRWNDGSEDQRFPGIGNPQSRGLPTWFILPEEIAEVVISMLKVNKKISE